VRATNTVSKTNRKDILKIKKNIKKARSEQNCVTKRVTTFIK